MPRGTSPLDEARLQGRLWTPRILRADTALWVDFSDPSSMTFSGGNIATIACQTGSGTKFFEGDSANYPAYSGQINGRLCSTWASNALYTNADASMATANWGFVWVGSMGSGTANFGRLLSFSVYGGGTDWNIANHFALLTRDSTNQTVRSDYNSAGKGTLSVVYDQPMVVSGFASGTDYTLSVDGRRASATSYSTPLSSGGRFNVGFQSTNPWSFSRFTGRLGEIVVVRGISRATLERVEGYAAARWGIPLAGTHPYRNRPPLIGG